MPFTLPSSLYDFSPPVKEEDIDAPPGGFAMPPALASAYTYGDSSDILGVVPPPVEPPVEVNPPPPPEPQSAPPSVPPVAAPQPVEGGGLREYARSAAQRAGIDPDLFERQIQQESNFDPNAGSPAGAQGIAQIVPKWHPGVNPWNPTEALDYAANLMARHLQTYGGDISKALVAYNGGGGAVAQYEAGTPYEESQIYLRNILGGGGPPVPAGGDAPPTAPYQPGRPPTSLAEELAAGQAEGLVPTPETAPGRDVLSGIADFVRPIADIGRAASPIGPDSIYQGGWQAGMPPPGGLESALNAIPVIGPIGRVGARGLGTMGAQIADVASGLLGGPGVSSMDEVLRPLSQGARMAAEGVGDALSGMEFRGPGTVAPTPAGMQAETLGMTMGVPPPGPTQPPRPTAAAPVTPLDNLLGLRPISPGLNRQDRMANVIRHQLGNVEADEVATPAMRERARVQPVIDSLAGQYAAQAAERVRAVFPTDQMGRITSLADPALGFPQGPTVQDLAARLPQFLARLNPEQQQVMVWLRDATEPFRKLWEDVGARELHTRMDVMPGGFYLPRGRADAIDPSAPLPQVGGATRRGKAGFEKAATFNSMAEGIDAKHRYVPLHDALQTYAKEAGGRITDQHVSNYFLNQVDPATGKKLGTTAADRIDPVLQAEVQTLRAKIHARRVTLTRQNVRETMTGREAQREGKRAARAEDLLQKAQDRFNARLAGKNTDEHVVAAERELRVLREQEARDARRWAATTARKGQGMSPAAQKAQAERDFKAWEAAEARAVKAEARLNDAITKNRPDAVTKAAQREALIRRQQATTLRHQADASQARADAAEGKRTATEASLRNLQAALDSIKGRYQHELELARQTPQGQGQINLTPLQGHAFPLAIANAANAVLASEQPLSGRGADVAATVNALNHLYRGVRATGDLSALGIQGLLGAAKNRKAYREALNITFKALGNNGDRALGALIKNFDDEAAANGAPNAAQWARAGLHIGGAESEFTVGLGVRGVLAKAGQLPVVRQTNRAFGFFGDALRLQWAQDELATITKRTGLPPSPADMEGIAKALNGATGWSPEKFANDWGDLVMFAPRYFASRMETIARIAGAPGATNIEKQIARGAMVRLVGGGVTLTALANWARGEETDFRPWVYDDKGNARRNPNFLKIRNLLGQDISLLGSWDSLAGMMVDAATGNAARSLRSMGSGAATLVWDLGTGKDSAGRPVRDNPRQFAEWVARTWSPFIGGPVAAGVTDVVQGIQTGDAEEAAGGVLGTGLGIVGVKAAGQSYSDIREELSQSRYSKPWSELDTGQRREIREEQDLLDKKAEQPPIEDFGTPGQQASQSFRRYEQVKTSLEASLRAKLDNKMSGKALNDAISEFQHDRFRASEDLLQTPEVQEALRRDNKPLRDIYAEQYYDVNAPEDLRTGDLDFQALERGRLAVLQAAQAAGLTKADLDYITGTGKETFRGARFKDPVVRAAVEARERDQETLKPYYEAQDNLMKMIPAYRAAVEAVEAQPEGSVQRYMAEQNPVYQYFQQSVTEQRQAMRLARPELDAAGVRLRGWRPIGLQMALSGR